MRKEIGSNFCEKLEKANIVLKDNSQVMYFDSGRSAYRYFLTYCEMNLHNVMLPQYTCQSVIEPFEEMGINISYYPINENLQVNREVFCRLFMQNKPDMILVQTYFGFDTWKEERELLENIRKSGTLILEDVTHCVLADNWKNCSDYKVASLRKWCGIPDGGFLAVSGNRKNAGLRKCHSINENIEYVTERLKAQEEKRKYFSKETQEDITEKMLFIQCYDKSERILDEQTQYYTMSQYARERIAGISWQEIATRRRQNYSILRTMLDNVKGIRLLNYELDKGIVPLYFPMFIFHGREQFRNHMREKNIMLPIIWPVPENVEGHLDRQVREIYDSILVVPCDQRYGEEDMTYVAKEILEYMKTIGSVVFL